MVTPLDMPTPAFGFRFHGKPPSIMGTTEIFMSFVLFGVKFYLVLKIVGVFFKECHSQSRRKDCFDMAGTAKVGKLGRYNW